MGIFFERRQWTAEPFVGPFPGANAYGQASPASDPDTALQVPTVWACVSLLANAVSMLPLETFRRTAGVPQRITDPQLLTAPADGMTQSEWLHMLMVSLLLRGNAFGKIVAKDSSLRPTQIELLNPDQMKVTVDRVTGAVTYTYSGALMSPNDLWHVRGMTMPGAKVGLSPIAYAAATLGVDLSSRMFAQDFFTGGGIPKAVLKSDQNINQEQARTIKERMLAATRSREPIVLGQGLDYNQISVNPEESQFLATQMANVGQIARYFGVPAGMVGGNEGGSMTYTNIEQRSLDFLTYGVSFWLKRIEDAVFVLLPQPQYVRFNTANLLRTDAHTQALVDNMQLAGKVRVPSELRNRDGLPEYTEAQQAEADMVPLTITAQGMAKALPALKMPPGPTAPIPPAEVTVNNYQAPVEIRQPFTVEAARAADVYVNVEPSVSEIRVEQPITVNPAAVTLEQPITVQPAAPAEVRLEQPITVQPAEVRMVTVEQPPRSKRVERNADGEITAIVEV